MKVVSQRGIRYIAEQVTKLLFAEPRQREALGVNERMIGLLLKLEVPRLRGRLRGEFTAEVMRHLMRWLKVSLDFRQANHPRA